MRKLLTAVVAVVAAGGIALLAANVGGADPVIDPPKSEAPANINPDKHPVLDPAQVTSDPAPALTATEQREEAQAWAAQDPNSRVVCIASNGAVAGTIVLDTIDPSKPLSQAGAAGMCADGFPGSRP
jgi:Flp pilus assembly protein CpaB